MTVGDFAASSTASAVAVQFELVTVNDLADEAELVGLLRVKSPSAEESSKAR